DDNETKTASTTRPTTATTLATTTVPTFLPGDQGGGATTLATQPPVATTTPAAVPASPATTAPPVATTAAANPAAKIAFSYTEANCDPNGTLTVFGTVTNNNTQAYSFSYTITVLRSDGTVQGTAQSVIDHIS